MALTAEKALWGLKPDGRVLMRAVSADTGAYQCWERVCVGDYFAGEVALRTVEMQNGWSGFKTLTKRSYVFSLALAFFLALSLSQCACTRAA